MARIYNFERTPDELRQIEKLYPNRWADFECEGCFAEFNLDTSSPILNEPVCPHCGEPLFIGMESADEKILPLY